MNYTSGNNTTKTGGSLVENLTKKNAEQVQAIATSTLPVMVPIQEKDWDTMVSLLKSAVDFQPNVYRLIDTLLTEDRMASMMQTLVNIEQDYFQQVIREMESKLRTQQTAVENILRQMKDNVQQAGSHLEKTMNDTLEKGKKLEEAIASTQKKTDRRTWIIRTAISVGSSVVAAVLSTLLCFLCLV